MGWLLRGSERRQRRAVGALKYPPASNARGASPFSEEEKEAFRWRIEALANGVDRIKRLADPENEPPDGVIRRNRIDLIRQAASLVADVCGDWVKTSELDAPDITSYLSLTLQLWQPVIAMHDAGDSIWDEVISEIDRLRFGDEPEILRAVPRPPGSHRQPAKLTYERLSALRWAAFLKSLDTPARIVHFHISLAYGTDWDAIRKWRGAAEKLFGAPYVLRALEEAASGWWISEGDGDYLTRLHAFGSRYRQLVGIPPLEFETFRTAVYGNSTR